ncbi:MAG: biotin/lipoyl-binding protein [bacterium]|nr:biotin/lipoyl-binding protein [bacterium]
MRNFLVNVNGTSYEISVEEIDGKTAAASAATPAAAPAAPAAAPAPAAPAAAPAAGEATVKAPMPGNILSVNVKVGDAVKKGQVVMILEAMKMENEILSPVDGTVSAVFVQQGATVNPDAALCSIR